MFVPGVYSYDFLSRICVINWSILSDLCFDTQRLEQDDTESIVPGQMCWTGNTQDITNIII